MKRDFKTTLRRALVFVAPFLLISAAVVFFAFWAADNLLEKNVYYKLATLAPERPEEAGVPTRLYAEFTPEEREELKKQNEEIFQDEDVPPIRLGEVWAHITIESAQVDDQPVYHGDSSDLLVKGIGHYANSRFPGQHGKVVMAGHVGIKKHFQRLETMSAGDLVTLNTIYGDYVYRVTSTRVYDEDSPDLIDLIRPDDEDTGDRLICYTCYPYHTTRVRTQRFVIDCELISGYDYVLHKMIGEDGTLEETDVPAETAGETNEDS